MGRTKIAVDNVFIKLFGVDGLQLETMWWKRTKIKSMRKQKKCCVNAMPQHKTWKRYKGFLRRVKSLSNWTICIGFGLNTYN